MYVLERNVAFLDKQEVSYSLHGEAVELEAFKLAVGGMALASIHNQDYDYEATGDLVQQLFSGRDNISGEHVTRELRRILDNRNNFYLDHRKDTVIASAAAGQLATKALKEELGNLEYGYDVIQDAFHINNDGYYCQVTEDGLKVRDYSIGELNQFYEDGHPAYGLASELGATAYRFKANVLLDDASETFETAAVFNGLWVGDEIREHIELGREEAGEYYPLVTVLDGLHPAVHKDN